MYYVVVVLSMHGDERFQRQPASRRPDVLIAVKVPDIKQSLVEHSFLRQDNRPHSL